MKQLVPGHTAEKGRSWDLNLCFYSVQMPLLRGDRREALSDLTEAWDVNMRAGALTAPLACLPPCARGCGMLMGPWR